jgi:hypothetical protein
MDTKSQKSFKSASSRSGSSRRSAISDDESEEEPVKKSKSKSTAKKATSDKSAPVATSGNRSFLTAAEQRTQDKKNEKKEGESPYAFLADIRDVLISLAPLYNAHRLCNSRKMEIAPTILNMIQERSTSLPRLGKNSLPLKSRYASSHLPVLGLIPFATVLGDQAKSLRYGLSNGFVLTVFSSVPRFCSSRKGQSVFCFRAP